MRSTVPPKTRGQCGTCGGDYEVRKDGKLPKHGPRGEARCDGGEKRPTTYKATGVMWKARER